MSDQSGYVPPTPPEQPAPPPPAPPMTPPPPVGAPAGMAGRPAPVNDTSKLLSAGGYIIWLVALIAILIDPYKDEKFVRFHGIQALGFTVGVFVLSIALQIVSLILSQLGPAALLMLIIWPVFSIGILVVAIMWAVKAYNGDYAEMPIVYGFVKNYIGE